MEIDIRKEQIKERKADSQGRISLPSTRYGDQIVELAVLGTRDPEENVWERREDKETVKRVYVWWHTDRDDEVQVVREKPENFTIQGVRAGHDHYEIDTAESAEEAYKKAENWMEKNPGPD